VDVGKLAQARSAQGPVRVLGHYRRPHATGEVRPLAAPAGRMAHGARVAEGARVALCGEAVGTGMLLL
jgi:hypothetical protein